MRRPAASAAVLVTALALACNGRDYVYEPVVSTSASVAGRPASYYAIPAEAPRGDVRVATFGIVEIHQDGDDENHALHMRVIVANNGQRPWTIDTREQRLVLARDGESRPAFATADGAGTPPLIVVPPGGKRTVDLFFPLPEHLQEAEELPAFDTIWTVDTGTRVVTERTPFERLVVEPVYRTDYAWGYGWGPPYWYDPWYPRGAFIGARAPLYTGRPVVIQRSPVYQAPPARAAPPARPDASPQIFPSISVNA